MAVAVSNTVDVEVDTSCRLSAPVTATAVSSSVVPPDDVAVEVSESGPVRVAHRPDAGNVDLAARPIRELRIKRPQEIVEAVDRPGVVPQHLDQCGAPGRGGLPATHDDGVFQTLEREGNVPLDLVGGHRPRPVDSGG